MSAARRPEVLQGGGIDPALLAAIGAAALEVWPRASPATGGAGAGPGWDVAGRWRFSGRWWARQLPAGRALPWIR